MILSPLIQRSCSGSAWLSYARGEGFGLGLLLGLLCLAMPLAAEQYGDFTYEIDGSSLIITGYDGRDRDVVIPDKIDGRPVTSIGDSAFKSHYSLTSVVIPDDVISIGDSAFSGCFSLASVVIPDGVVSIGRRAFGFCYDLTSVVIPAKVTSIGVGAFTKCSSMVEISVVEENAAYSSLDGVLFNKDQTRLVEYPGGRSGSYVIPGSVTTIGSEAFDYCSSLTSVAIPDSVTSIEGYAFHFCLGLKNVVIPDSVTSIGFAAFQNCKSLTSAVISAGITAIEPSTFSACDSLTSVVIPESVTSIGNRAFYQCHSLTSVVIPASILMIEALAFAECSSLTGVLFAGDAPGVGHNFAGDAPGVAHNAFANPASGFTFYYYEGARRFSSPTWKGYPAVELGRGSVEAWRVTHFGVAEEIGIAADEVDADGDGASNADEFIAGTDPRNSDDVFRVVSSSRVENTFGLSVDGKTGRVYVLMRSDDLGGDSWTSIDTIGPLEEEGVVNLTDTAASGSRGFYRVSVEKP